MGFSAVIANDLIKDYFPDILNCEYGELIIPEQSGKKLPLSIFARFARK